MSTITVNGTFCLLEDVYVGFTSTLSSSTRDLANPLHHGSNGSTVDLETRLCYPLRWCNLGR